jgi:putative ABC transport system permease protein
MIRSYIRTALRNFKRNSMTSFINLSGLSLGLASCLVAGLYIRHELSADQFHRDINAIYHVSAKLRDFNINGTPYPFAEAIEKDLPAVKATLRTANEETFVQIGDERFKHDVALSDPNFFSFFTFSLRHGNAAQALNGLRQVVISADIRQQYFASKDPVGQTLQILLDNEWVNFEITGVLDPPTAFSSIAFDFLIPLENRFAGDQQAKNDWGSFFITSFVKVDPGQIASVREALPDFSGRYLEKKNSDGTPYMSFVLRAFADHHLHNGFSGGGLKEGRSAKSLYVFAGVSLIILLLACFNFMNLTNAQSSRRAVEVGIRKVVGAGRSQLIRQFISEALMLSVFAAVLALGIAELSLLAFRDVLGVSISVFNGAHGDIYAGFLAVTLFAGLLAGSYPAIVLSRISALKTFRRYFRVGGSNWITRSILSLQFCLSVVLIVCAVVMWKQQHYMMNKDLGYNKEQVLVIPFSNRDTASVDFVKAEIKKLGEAVNVTRSSSAFTRGNNITFLQMPDDSRMAVYAIGVDDDYLPTMAIEVVRGVSFHEDQPGGNSTILINETMMKALSLQDSIGVKLNRTIGWVGKPTIAGVVKDFHHSQLQWKIQPLMLLYNRRLSDTYLMVRIAPGQILNARRKIENIWTKVNKDSPFEYFFLDDDINNQYASETRWSKIITIATGMAIFLSMLGLVGLAMFTAEQRRKEVGIRKVLGASLRQLIALLSKDYVWLILVAFMFGAPVAYLIMTNYWLTNFAYHIPVDAFVYLITLAMVLCIAVVAVGSQTIRAAMQNPAETLKEE